MKSYRSFWVLAVSVLATLLLAGCGGTSSNSTPPPNSSFQLTVTAPAAGAGTITSSPAGINCPSTCTASYPSGTKVTLTATPGSNYFFGGWGGACSGTTCTITISAPASVSASFVPGDGLTVAIAGSGTVTSTPAGINCPTTCSGTFPENGKVTLTETPGSGDFFSGWSGSTCSGTAPCTLTITAATNVTATFSPNAGGNVLSVTTTGAGIGTVTSTPAGINCSAGSATSCSATFAPNSMVTLTETPAANNVFAGWSGGCTGTGACSVTLSASSNSVTATFGGSLQANINHIVLFSQENRSFDHYFGYMRQYWANNGITDQSFDGLPQFNPTSGIAPLYGNPPAVPGCNLANDANSCDPDPTNPITSFHFASVCEENQSPFWNEAHNDWDYANPADQPAETTPPLNGFVYTAAYDARSNNFMDVNGVRAMGYYQDTDLNYYYSMATNFGTSDRWFSPVMDRTQVNRMYILAATSQGDAYPIGGGYNDDKVLTATTIFESLQAAGITWKIYVNPVNTSFNGVNCETAAPGQDQDICLAGVSYMNMFAYESQIQNASTNLWQHFAPISQFAIDAQDDATFPQFSLIEPASSAGLDEHPSDSDGSPVNVQDGAYYVQNTIIDPFMRSAAWNDSALIFTYDEAGGLYDHVPPQPAAPPGDFLAPTDLESSLGDICTKSGQTLGQGTCSFAWTGYRVPVIVISPYSVKNFVSHTVRDATAVLAMVETRFGIAPLTGRDASYKNNPATSMNEFFDFVNKPWATPPSPLPQSKSGTCDQTPPASWNEPPVLTVAVSGTGSVSSSPAGIDACTSTTESCSAPFSTGTIVTLTATPGTGSTFTGWSGAGCTGTSTCSVTMTGAESVTAAFTP